MYVPSCGHRYAGIMVEAVSILRTTASLVCYKSDFSEVESLLQSLRGTASISRWVVVDNSAQELPAAALHLRSLVEEYGGLYVDPGGNHGFGAGHNAALAALKDFPSAFHLMLNPDIVFDEFVIPQLEAVMDADEQISLLMPRVWYPDRSNQYLCKLLPTPLDFALRRFAPGPLKGLARRSMDTYELRNMDPERASEIPFLSGCFMFTRRHRLEAVGGFDEHYFLYMEDVDLCRRLSRTGKLIYWPGVHVMHRHERGSHNNWKLTLTHIRSSIRYFNCWGWFFDKDRRRINREALKNIFNSK
jgi:GT2 family glycosyltransferase